MEGVMLVWTHEQQKEILERIGYDVSKWDNKNPVEVEKLSTIAINTMLDGLDKNGNHISYDDYQFLATVTSRS